MVASLTDASAPSGGSAPCVSAPRLSEHERLLKVGEAAALLQVTSQTVIRWADAGALPCGRTPGGHRRFREDDVEALRQRLSVPRVVRPARLVVTAGTPRLEIRALLAEQAAVTP
jgi:excisionase family DNA binding protein